RWMKLENVLAYQHAENERDGSREDAPEKKADTELLETEDETRSCGNPHHRDEYIESELVHEPDSRFGNASERRVDGAKPAEHDASDQSPSRGRERQRDCSDVNRDCTDERAHGYRQSDKGHICRTRRPVQLAKYFGCSGGVLCPPNEGYRVAPMKLRA